MKVLGIIATVLLFTACGAQEPSDVQAIPIADGDPHTLVLEASLNLYREQCRKVHDRCDYPVEIYANPYLDADTNGRCDAGWEGTTLKLAILINEDAMSWSRDMLDLLVAHEAEHCLRGVAHDESEGAHLMRPQFLSREEIGAKSYRAWLEESFQLARGDATKL